MATTPKDKGPKMQKKESFSGRNAQFLAFLDKIGYEPQGRYAKAGKLRQVDVEVLMKGPLEQPLLWMQDNLKTPQEIDILRRNLSVSHQETAPTTSEMLELKQARCTALAQKKLMLQEAIAKTRKENDQTLADIAQVEERIQALSNPQIPQILEDTYKLQRQYRQQERQAAAADIQAQIDQRSVQRTADTSSEIETALDTLHAYVKSKRGSAPTPNLFPDPKSIPHEVNIALQQPGTEILHHIHSFHSTVDTAVTIHKGFQLKPPPTNILAQIQSHLDSKWSQLEERQMMADDIYDQIMTLYEALEQDNADGSEHAIVAAQLHAVQKFCQEKEEELRQLMASQKEIEQHMEEVHAFEKNRHELQIQIASAFQRNRSAVVDILDQQSKLLLFIQTHIVEAFQGLRVEYEEALTQEIDYDVAEWRKRSSQSSSQCRHGSKSKQEQREHMLASIQTCISKLEDAKNAYDSFLQSSPCFALVSNDALLSQKNTIELDMNENTLPDLARLQEVCLNLQQRKLPSLEKTVESWRKGAIVDEL